jgi:hypothetical protein
MAEQMASELFEQWVLETTSHSLRFETKDKASEFSQNFAATTFKDS